jgi:hypothetical protein
MLEKVLADLVPIFGNISLNEFPVSRHIAKFRNQGLAVNQITCSKPIVILTTTVNPVLRAFHETSSQGIEVDVSGKMNEILRFPDVFELVLPFEEMTRSALPHVYRFDIAFADKSKVIGNRSGTVLPDKQMEVIRHETVGNDGQRRIQIFLHPRQEKRVIAAVKEDLIPVYSAIVDVEVFSGCLEPRRLD